MTTVDYVIIVVCVVSALVGVWRGFTREAVALFALLAAVWLAWRFAWVVEPYLGDWAGAPDARTLAARSIVFVAVLIIGAVASYLARTLVRHSGLSGVDRSLGAVFGVARGVVLVGVGVIVLQFTELDQSGWWQEARLKAYGERVAAGLRYYAELGQNYIREQYPAQPV